MSVVAQLRFTDAGGRLATVRVRVVTKTGEQRLVQLEEALVSGDYLLVSEEALTTVEEGAEA